MRGMAARARPSRQRVQEAWYFRLFILPWLIGVVAFVAGPMVFSLVMSLMRWNLGQNPTWTGLGNYAEALHDPLVWQALKVTTIFTFTSVPLGLIVALGVAVLLNQRIRFLGLFRTLYYLPAVISGVPVALLWVWILNTQYGLLNGMLWQLFHLQGPDWLGSVQWVLPSFVLISLWGIGQPMVIFLAGLQGVPRELYEAAQLDGASGLRQFWHVTLPMVSPVLFFNLVTGLISAYQVFTLSYVMTNGGPSDASLFYVLYLFQVAWVYFRMGYASALAWILFVIIMLFTAFLLRTSNWWVYYEGRL